jgi:NADP-dependent 3-hydroxy acid dehydrogenase YdfG
MGKVLIWGGSGGIGAATARALFSQGIDLHLVGRDANRLAVLAEELGCTTSQAAVEDDDAFERVSAEAGATLRAISG